MSEKSCYTEVVGLVKEAELRFASNFAVDKKVEQKMKAICTDIDKMITKLEFGYYKVAIDDTDKRLTVSLFCDEIILEGEQSQLFCSLVKKISSFSFVKSEDGGIRIDLNIDGLWAGK